MDRIEALELFVSIADLGSFAAAARQHRVSPQTATRAVSILESRLGVILLRRSTRALRLTEEGAIYLAQCRQILADLEAADRSLAGGATEPHGTLTITAPDVFGRRHVVPVAVELMARYPALSVRLMLVDRFVQLTEEGIDVAIRIGELADSALRVVKVGEVRRLLVASPAYIDAHGHAVRTGDLKRHAIISFTGMSAGDVWRFGAVGERAVRIQPRLTVNSADAAIAAAIAGAGICRVLSYQVSADLAAGRLVTLLDDEVPPPLPVNILFQSARAGAPNIRAFIDAARPALQAATA